MTLDNAPDIGQKTLKIDFDLSKTEAKLSEVPDNMEVFMSEIINGNNYRFDKQTGFVITKPGEDPIKSGDYYILSYGGTLPKEDYEIVGADSFDSSENASSIDNLEMKLRILTNQEVVERYCHGLNYMTSPHYSVPAVENFYLSNDSKVPVSFNGLEDTVTVRLAPSDMNVRLDFSFILKTEAEVKIDSVFCAVSGVPTKLRLVDATVRKDSLGKTFFRMNYDSPSGRCVGSVCTWGIFSSETEDETNGSGMLWICATATCRDSTVVMGTGVNLKSMIDEMEIMKSNDRERWKSYVKSASFPITKEFLITKETILSHGKDRVDDWIIINDDSLLFEL